jgi:hypothetical protein
MFGVASLMAGLRALVRGRMFYQNFWGSAVFVPLTAFIGIFVLFVALFRWDKFQEKGSGEKKSGP